MTFDANEQIGRYLPQKKKTKEMIENNLGETEIIFNKY